MRKAAFILVVVAMVVACLGLVACGSGESAPTDGNGITTDGNGAPTDGNGTTTDGNGTTTDGNGTTPGGGGITWGDMPVYPGASQISKGSWGIPAEDEEWSQVEWRYYQTGDSVEVVVTYYKAQMPANGWQEQGWMEMQAEGLNAWGYYTKNGEADGAMFWGTTEGGKTVFALMRAIK